MATTGFGDSSFELCLWKHDNFTVRTQDGSVSTPFHLLQDPG